VPHVDALWPRENLPFRRRARGPFQEFSIGRYRVGMTVRRRVLITGRVQGVGFRYAVAERARTRGVRGFVRNLASGQVEAALEGEPEAVAAMVDFCRRGPLGARVDGIDVSDEAPRGEARFSAG
jgi:acylphosphatase